MGWLARWARDRAATRGGAGGRPRGSPSSTSTTLLVSHPPASMRQGVIGAERTGVLQLKKERRARNLGEWNGGGGGGWEIKFAFSDGKK